MTSGWVVKANSCSVVHPGRAERSWFGAISCWRSLRVTLAGGRNKPDFLALKAWLHSLLQVGPGPARPKIRALEGEAEGTSYHWTASLWVGKVHRPRCSGWTESCASFCLLGPGHRPRLLGSSAHSPLQRKELRGRRHRHQTSGMFSEHPSSPGGEEHALCS